MADETSKKDEGESPLQRIDAKWQLLESRLCAGVLVALAIGASLRHLSRRGPRAPFS